MKRIVVVGSINMDIVNRVHAHPKPGETVQSIGTSYHPGGKGANQAVAAAQAAGSAGRVAMVGAVGTDAFGGELLGGLRSKGVDVKGVRRIEGVSGLAFITVSGDGENSIIVNAGANGAVSPLQLADDMWHDAAAVLVQNEIPWETNRAVLERAAVHGVPAYMNPAPAFRLPDDVMPLVSCLIVNESEAELMTGIPVGSAVQAEEAAGALLARGARSVIVTLGRHGAQYVGPEGSMLVPAFPARPVDTTAAGDTFIGAFAAARSEGKPLRESLRFASAAAALAVTRPGAQQSIPTRDAIERFASSHGTSWE
ncbi:ribokinase [Gordoniibacillus kamchatkensis]|uniref:Ribokinase n=2 Tax=Gordoniibacillus kamchatkensis TaxID=1590651 RepID=A0ABR5AC33_9BACL|nr:ribokinase [Paenibacillus sp. VKM B-2647]KIL38238.1 ribokinase [Paenibacillus sp. VKM B-2647]